MAEYDWTDPEALRASIGPEHPRTLPEMIDLALAAAIADADLIEIESHDGSHQSWVNGVIGFNLIERIREILSEDERR